MTAYYNEFDPYAAQWLRNLIDAGHIAKGEVDDRSITEVKPDDLKGFTQCHFFAGIGGWSLAARLAGWPDDRPLWTGSAPCQPFSTAGNQKGQDDERHLWPKFFELIRTCKPTTIMGEQVSAAIRFGWLDGVSSDLEGEGYTTGSVIIPACAVNAPHRRDRLWFVADATIQPDLRGPVEVSGSPKRSFTYDGNIPAESSHAGIGTLADTDNTRPQGHGRPVGQHDAQGWQEQDGYSAENSFWHGAEYLTGPDGKARRIEPSIRLLVDGVSESLDGLRAIEEKIIIEFMGYCNESKDYTIKKMCELRDYFQSKKGWEEQSIGMCFELYEKEVLLPFLLCIISAFESSPIRGSIKEENHAPLRRAMQFLQSSKRFGRPSYRWESYELVPRQSSNTLHILSLLLARHAEAYWEKSYNANASSNRVGKLRAYGNAIVPQVAAEVIKAYMETRP